jgi:hypothetical protein
MHAASAQERAMANKPEFVDLIRDATRQRRREPPRKIIAKPEVVTDEGRLSRWPPTRFARWRLAALVPWKLNVKNWQFKDWL